MSSREDVLARVRSALAPGGGPAASVVDRTPPVRVASSGDAGDLVERLCERFRDLGTEVVRGALGDVGDRIDEICRDHGVRRLAVPTGLPVVWRPRSTDVVEDHDLPAEALAGFDGAVVGCTLAIAETGTVVLTAGAAEGRRVLSLVPDFLVCIVRETDVVADLPAALPVLARLVREDQRPVVFISGPSATSDIELNRVQGVHGPRHLVMLVVCG